MNLPERKPGPPGIASAFWKLYGYWMTQPYSFNRKLQELIKAQQGISPTEAHSLIPAPEDEPQTYIQDAEKLLEYLKHRARQARKHHVILANWLRNMVQETPVLEEREKKRALFWTNRLLDALSPANYFWTNPTAVQRFLDSEGRSLQDGLNHWREDMERGHPLVKMADDQAFRIGENIACTAGMIIYRNALMELIQYTPVTDKIYRRPVLIIPPWINKYYIFDLTEQNSFIRFLIHQGFNVFMISWKNPTAGMRNVTFEDYLFQGALKAAEVVQDVGRSKTLHAAGYCIGGTLLASLMAWLSASARDRKGCPVADWTLFTTLTDFSDPGEISVFINDENIEFLESIMAHDGGLDAKFIGIAFRLLRSDSLIWQPFIQQYLYGEKPPKSDILFWNSDGVRLPEAMASFYLRRCYLENRLVQKYSLVLGQRPIDLGKITQPLYSVGAVQDHISPWRGTFQTGLIVKGPVRYVLAGEGHIAGVVSPPSDLSRNKYQAGEVLHGDEPEAWKSGQPNRRGSWWPDWVQWLRSHSAAKRKATAPGSRNYPPLEPAPGFYVSEH